jgi:hypothetical protein
MRQGARRLATRSESEKAADTNRHVDPVTDKVDIPITEHDFYGNCRMLIKVAGHDIAQMHGAEG